MSASLRPWVRDLVGAALLAARVTRPSRRGRGRLTIVTFHRVLPEAERAAYPYPGLVVTPAELEAFLGFLTRHYRCGTLRETAARWRAGADPQPPLAALTFDDGQWDNFVHAAPALERRGLCATFFAVAGQVGSSRPLWHDRLGYALARLSDRGERDLERAEVAVERAKRLGPAERERWIEDLEARAGGSAAPDWDGLMDWDQLASLVERGHEVGCHSMTHALLPALDDPALEREVAGSRERIESKLGVPVESFCYPNGDCDARVIAAVGRAGYRHAVTTRWGRNGPGANALALRRCDLQARHATDRNGAFSEARLAWRLSGLHPGPGM